MANKHDILLQIGTKQSELAQLFADLAAQWPADGASVPPPVTSPPVDPASLTARLANWNSLQNNRLKADTIGQDGELRQYVYFHWPTNWPETYNQWVGHAQMDNASATTSNAPQIS